MQRIATRSLRFFRRWASTQAQPRESMEYDVVVVGAGPAGLSSAIRLKQLAQKHKKEISVCVVEKGHEVGAHILSGNVFDPVSLNELVPDWKSKGAPLTTPVSSDKLLFLTKNNAIPLPVPSMFNNHGNYIISLGELCRWLASQAEQLGVEIYPGQSAAEVLYGDKGEVLGIATSDVGISKAGIQKDSFARGMELRGKQTFFAEGCRGSLSETVMDKYNLRKDCDPQTYGIGLKEVWEVDQAEHKPGLVTHTVGWPVPDSKTWMGSFMYHQKPNLVFLGLVVGLDYQNPYLNPYLEFQKFKHHPQVAKTLKGGKIISYGARAINEGGYQSLPKLTFPGGALVGCSAGFLNVPKIKGSHYAMKSGMVAADAFFDQFAEKEVTGGVELSQYETTLRKSWVYSDLHKVRNIHPSLERFGLLGWMAYTGLTAYLLKGKESWTFRNKEKLLDSQKTKPKNQCSVIEYPKPDGVLSFDILTNLQRTGVNHEEDQPSHLKIKPGMEKIPLDVSYSTYDGPEQRFCPAKVYEYVKDGETGIPKLVINAQNCIHCKTCSIKTPKNYINWTVPEGGGGPAYGNM